MIRLWDRLLLALSSLLSGLGFLLYLFAAQHRAPKSLAEALGVGGAGLWVYGLVGLSGVLFVLCVIPSHACTLRAESLGRIAQSTLLAGYAAALVAAGAPPWITVGLAVNAVLWNLVRMRQIVQYDLPTVRAVDGRRGWRWWMGR